MLETWERENITHKHWISFDAHGWVISFDQNLIEMQSTMNGIDKRLFRKLGFMCIESLLAKELNVFYKV